VLQDIVFIPNDYMISASSTTSSDNGDDVDDRDDEDVLRPSTRLETRRVCRAK
jgi:hypothetical protein